MKNILCLLLAIAPFLTYSQRLHADLFGGIANYQGDLQGKRFTFSQAKPAVGLGVSYDLTNKFILRTGFTYAKIAGDDRQNSTAKGIELRNLNFTSTILELHLGAEYNIFDLAERSFTPYVFAGVAGFRFNPYTTDQAGNKVYLQPLSTEGQGLPEYPDSKPYKLTQFAIPFGGGIKLSLTENLQVGLELGLRKLFTDHLDDVSGTYADSTILANAKGPQAVGLAWRGDEVNGAPYPEAGSQRGNPKNKDWYYMTGIRISYLLGNGSGGKGVSCPKAVF